MIIVYLALTTALAALALGVLIRSFLYGTELLDSVALIELFWLVVSVCVLWLLPMPETASLVAQYLVSSTAAIAVVYAFWANRQPDNDHEFYPRWYRYTAFFYNLILFALAANALHSTCVNSCAIALQEEYRVLLPSVLILGALLLTSHLSGKALMRQGNNEWHGQALEAILAHPTCEATFGTITDIYFMEEESPWYNEPDVLAYWIEGNKASGHLVGRFISKDDKELLHNGHIQLEGGEAIVISNDVLGA